MIRNLTTTITLCLRGMANLCIFMILEDKKLLHRFNIREILMLMCPV